MKTLNAKTLFAGLAAVAAVTAVAAPAAAQPYRDYDRYEQGRYDNGRYDGDRYDGGRYDGGRYEQRHWDHRGGYNIDRRQEQIERVIERGIRQGALTRREVHELRSDLYSIRRLEAHYRVDGLNWRERAELDRRLDWAERRLEGRLNNREYGYGYGYGYGYRR